MLELFAFMCVHTKDGGNTENDYDDEDDGSKKGCITTAASDGDGDTNSDNGNFIAYAYFIKLSFVVKVL